MRGHCSLGRFALSNRAAARRPLLLPIRELQTTRDSIRPSTSSPLPLSSSGSTLSAVEGLPSHYDYRNLLQSCSRIFAEESPLRSRIWRKRLEEAHESLAMGSRRLTRIAGRSMAFYYQFARQQLIHPILQSSGHQNVGPRNCSPVCWMSHSAMLLQMQLMERQCTAMKI
jgi:hypothetical protein